ncbi:hypothetical protein R8Z50_24600 [Longispora sp. K20-0274]|uniref:hypothetical protein n=1 Tax=Longispora sp. K20-0274 TaxID=3088255 RepID=UPI00399B48B1
MHRRLTVGLLAVVCTAAGLAFTASPASAAATYPVKTTLDGRTVKDPEVPVGRLRVADKYPEGSSVTIVCQDDGPSYGGSTLWDLTTDGLWVPDAYVKTGSSGRVMGACSIPKSFPAKVTLNGRQNKGDAADAPGSVVDRYPAGGSVPVVCQAPAGGAIWDRTSHNLWVPDQYVQTGTTGYVSGLPRCDTDGMTGGGGGFPADPNADSAIAFARARLGHTDWNNQCELFVERAYGTSGRFATALAHYRWQRDNGRIHTGSVPPPGAAVFFTSTTSAGHIMLSIGNNSAISTGPSVYQTNTFRERSDYLGWAYVPSGW